MRTTSKTAILLCVAVLAGGVYGQNGQVKFRGTVTTDEAHDVVPVCYGDYHVTVDIGTVLEDPNGLLTGLDSVRVCYGTAQGLAFDDKVEVCGYYWGGICPKQYCKCVQILEAADYIMPVASYGDDDWMVSGDLMYSIPSGDVGIGTSQPAEKLHVVGNLLVEGVSSAWLRLLGVLGSDTGIILTTSGMGVNTWQILRDGASADLVIRESFPYLPFGGERVVVKAGTGYVGIGTDTPEYRLELPNTPSVAGRARANRWDTYSSQRWKTNVRTIDGAMDKVSRLRGVYFDWKDQGTHDMGMIAEEVGRVVPEVVGYSANGTEAESLAYDRLVALLVEALKEQQARIDELEQAVAKNRQLEQRLDTLERLVRQQQMPAADDLLHP
jgi:hypothetical protein